MAALDKAGASNHARPAVCPTVAGSHVSNGQVSDPRAKLRALAEAMGGPCIVRDADGNGFLLTVERLQFVQPAGSPPGSTGHGHNPARCGSDFHSFHEVLIDEQQADNPRPPRVLFRF